MGRGEIARNEQLLLLQKCFLSNQVVVSPFVHTFDIKSLFVAELEEPKIGISGKGLKLGIVWVKDDREKSRFSGFC